METLNAMRTITTLLGSAFCALAVLAAPLNAKEKSGSECHCKPDSCKCEKKGTCKCNEASCTCEKCKAVRAKQPNAPAPAPGAPATKSAASSNTAVNCDKDDDDDDDDDDKDAVCSEPETCPEKSPCCPGDKPAPSKESVNLDNHCGKCDKKDGDKPETCPEKSPCCPAGK